MVTIELPLEQRRKFRVALLRASRREIGGVLMGEQIAPDHFRVVDFSVDAVTGEAAHFVRSPEHHRGALDKFFAQTNADYRRFNYLGEWHSHPCFPVVPSSEDVASMRSLVDGERDIHFAALLIVRLRLFVQLEVAAFMFIRGRCGQRVKLVSET